MNALAMIKPVDWLRAAVYGSLLTGVYFSALSWLVTNDWSREDYSSSYFIPLIVLYLIWEKRGELARIPSVPTWAGLVPVGAGVLLFWLGELSGEFFTLYISFWLTLTGLCWMHLGWRKLRIVAFPVCFLLAMFPLPNFLYTKVSVTLKLISSKLGVAMLRLCGMTAFREGNVIDVGFTQLQVVDACSGLRYLIPLIALGCLVAYFYRGPLWQKVFLVISTVPLAIVTNGMRIASVGVLYPIWGPKVAEGFFHDFSGWLIFMCTLGLLLLEMFLMRRLFGRKGRGDDGLAPAHAGRAEEGTGRGEGRAMVPSLVAVALLLGTAALSQGVEFRDKVPIKKAFTGFPERVGQWSGVRQAMEEKYVEALDLSDYVIVNYSDPRGKEVNFYTAYYESQRKGESIHSPATCLPGNGWVFEESGGHPVSLADGRSITVNRAFMQKGEVRELVYYWFPQRGRVLTNAWELKLYAFWDALTLQRTDGALVRVITPVSPSERVETAEARLQAFTREIIPVLDGYLPGKDI